MTVKNMGAPWALLLFCLIFLSACGQASTGPEIAFEEVLSAIEEKDVDRIDALLTKDFVGNENRATLLSWARSSFAKNPTIRFNIVEQEVTENGSNATLRSTLGVASGSSFFPNRANRLQVETQWVKTDNGWQVRVAQWRRL